MIHVPITFEFQGKTYTGDFAHVNGAGTSSMFFLTVDKKHVGQLFYTNTWRFGSNAYPEMSELADHFGFVVTSWVDSLPNGAALLGME